MKHEYDENQRGRGIRISAKTAKRARSMFAAGMNATDVSEELNISYKTAKKIRADMQIIMAGIIDEEDDESPGSADKKYRWLQKHWNWKQPAPKKERKENAVGVGHKSNFRTPYRPDGIWR